METWQRRADSVTSYGRSEDGASIRSRARHHASKTAAIEAQLARAKTPTSNGKSHSPTLPVPPAPSATALAHSKPAKNGNISPTLQHHARAPTPKSRTAPTPAATAKAPKALALSSTDDSDDYQSAVDVSNPPSDAEDPDPDPATPQLTSFNSSRRTSSSHPSTADQTPRESLEHGYRAATIGKGDGFPKTIAARKQASNATLQG